MTDQELIAKARQHFTPGVVIGEVKVQRVREVGEQMPSDDVFLVTVEGVKVGTYGDYASKLYRRSQLADLFEGN
jgi:hypothetical protein